MTNTDPSSPHIVVAGASGYIGRGVIPKLLEKFPNARITALSRAAHASDDHRVEWRACDLFSLKSLEQALPATVDLAYYLVHSMGPTALVDQGSFADYDLILADNFARALATKPGLRQVIYLGGLVPQSTALSLHLQSRLEVEEVFREYKLPATVFRAGLILGEGGSSSQILLKLVKRLPIMICPKWTQTLTTPVALGTVLDALTDAALNQDRVNHVYDLAGCRPLSYLEMMQQTARHLKKSRYFLTVPVFTPTLSRLWVTLITNTPKALVYPLIESLEHKMVARPAHFYPGVNSDRSYAELLAEVPPRTEPRRKIFHARVRTETARSVQRFPLPAGRDAAWVKNQYLTWLPKAFAPFLRVNIDGDDVTFSVLTKRPALLKLKFSEERSSPDRQLLYIMHGGLAARADKGRLEFRTILNRKFVIAAIHDFKPSLPWLIYRHTQAVMHLIVMNAFRRRLKQI